MADLKERLAGLAVSAALLGGAAPAQAQVSAPVATASAKGALPSYSVRQWDSPTPQMLDQMKGLASRFDGTRQNYDQLTQGMPRNALEQFRMAYNQQNNGQKIAAEQSAGLMFGMKDKDAFSVLNKSIAAKASGQASDPVAQTQAYIGNKQADFDKLIDKRMQESDKAKPESLKQASDGDIQNVITQMREGHNQQGWAKSTVGWNKDSLTQLKKQGRSAIQGDSNTALQAAAQASKVDNKQMLTLMAGVKMSDGKPESAAANQDVRLNISAVEIALGKDMNTWTQEAQKQSIQTPAKPVIADKPPVSSVSSAADGALKSSLPPTLSVANPRKIEPVAAVLSAPAPVTATAAPVIAKPAPTTFIEKNYPAVSRDEISAMASSMNEKPISQWPNVSGWKPADLGTLRNDYKSQVSKDINAAYASTEAVGMGNSRGQGSEGIKNPELKAKIQNFESAHGGPGLSGQKPSGADLQKVKSYIDEYVSERTQGLNKLDKLIEISEKPKASVPSGLIPSDIAGPRLSGVDCKGDANNAAQGGTTKSVGGRLSVSPADIQIAAKDIMSKPRDQWPSLDSWDKNSIRALKNDVGQESANQINTVRQAVEGIRAGGDREALASTIANPVVREMVVTRTNANMSQTDVLSLQRDVTKEVRGNRDALNDRVKDERSDISQERRMDRAPVSAPGCAPGS